MAFVPYFDYLQSAEWRARAEAAKKRAGYRCQTCNTADRLEAHHRTYARLGHELDGDITVLCRGCHQAIEDHLAARRGGTIAA